VIKQKIFNYYEYKTIYNRIAIIIVMGWKKMYDNLKFFIKSLKLV